MKISLKWTNLEPIESLDVFVEEKIGGLAKFLEKYDATGVAEAWVEIGRTSQHHKTGGMVYRAETDIRLPGKVLRAEAAHKDLRQAIVTVKKELERQIKTYKEARLAKVDRGARLMKRLNNVAKDALRPEELEKGRRERDEGI
jgi:ribosomal subunit interface protein